MGMRHKNLVIENRVIIGWTHSQKLPGYEVKENCGSDKVDVSNLPQIKSSN